MTLVNQIENHAGKAVILKMSPEFEERYGLAARIDRNLWLTRTRFEPEYAGRPWLLWTANTALRSDAAEQPGSLGRWCVHERHAAESTWQRCWLRHARRPQPLTRPIHRFNVGAALMFSDGRNRHRKQCGECKLRAFAMC